MSSMVQQLQMDILAGKKPVTEILRTAKVISAKLDLKEIEQWLEWELNGYASSEAVPKYRLVNAGELQVRNPVNGWQMVGFLNEKIPVRQPIHEIEELATKQAVYCQLHKKKHFSEPMFNQFPQRAMISGAAMKSIVEGVRNEVLNWTIELEKRGIVGEGMQFQPNEKQLAMAQTFNIQYNIKEFKGVAGNVTNSQIALFDYSQVHQQLKELGVPQAERNKLENIMDELKTALPEKKQSITEKAKNWIVKNEKFLGVSIKLIRQSLGLEQS